MKRIELFTDGGSIEHGGFYFGASAFLIRDVDTNKKFLYSFYHGVNTDNNLAEALAIKHGLSEVKRMYTTSSINLKVITDSQYSLVNIKERFNIWKEKYEQTGLLPVSREGRIIKSFYIFYDINDLLNNFNSYELLKIKAHVSNQNIDSTYRSFIESNNMYIDKKKYIEYINFNRKCDLKIKDVIRIYKGELSKNEPGHHRRKEKRRGTSVLFIKN